MRKYNLLLKAFVAIVTMVSIWIPAIAHDQFEADGIYYNVTDETNKTVEVTSRTKKYSGAASIPSSVTYNGYTYSVTEIGDYAFARCSALTSITIPNTVTEIGYRTFEECKGLTSIFIPNSVTKIGDEAFAWCEGLTKVTIPNSVTLIGNGAFNGCTSLTEVSIGNSVTEIGGAAFLGCTGLTSVTIPNSVTTIGNHAFSSCEGLTIVKIPNSITTIGAGVFCYCTNLTFASIPNSVTTIGNSAFHGCTSLTSVSIPNSVTSIEYGAFRYCTNLTIVNIPKSITSIGDEAFAGCGVEKVNIFDLSAWCKIKFGNIMANPSYVASNMYLNGEEIKDLVIPEDITEIKQYVFAGLDFETVKIHDKVISIGDSAFYFCDRFTDITIPNSVTTIGGGAFEGCNLETVTSYCETPPVCDYNAFYDSYSAILKVPVGTKDAYANAPEWEKFTNIQEIAGVEDVEVDNNAVETSRYDIHGRRLSEPAKGINIVKMSDGSTKKIMIKD